MADGGSVHGSCDSLRGGGSVRGSFDYARGGGGSVRSGGGSVRGDEGGTSSASSSPRNRVKFLCSYGGKIMPRPVDGILKYVGGETRVIAVRRDINFEELMKKLRADFEGDTILKYQVMPEDLDVLVSVKSDEDLRHMFDEYDRHESEGTPKLRTFLFPSNPVVLENQTTALDSYASEQRYLDAINGTTRTVSNFRLPPINATRPTFSISASSSPKCTSPESNFTDSMPHEPAFTNDSYSHPRRSMVKVHSSPSLCSLGNSQHHQSNNLSSHHLYQTQHHYPPQHQQHYSHSYQSAKPPQDHHRLPTTLLLGRPEFGRAAFSPGSSQYYSSRPNMRSSKYSYYDEHTGYGYKVDRSESLPQSPKSRFQD